MEVERDRHPRHAIIFGSRDFLEAITGFNASPPDHPQAQGIG